jgi:hypothetical protein
MEHWACECHSKPKKK